MSEKIAVIGLVHDPKADSREMLERHRIELAPLDEFKDLAALVLASRTASLRRSTAVLLAK